LGAGEIPVITALNKIDKLDDAARNAAQIESKFPDSVAISVKSGYGLDELKRRIAEKVEIVL
jgi:50S ribosomal subunit-associated GTPase HflX